MVARKDVEMVRRRTLAVLALGAFFGHVVYPVTVGVLSRLAPRAEQLPPPGDPPEVPYATAVVPAFQEAGIIGDLVHRLLETPGTPVAEVVVPADDEETAEAARRAGAVVLTGPRRGKSSAVNRGVRAATHDVVILLDANVTIEVRDLHRLADHVRSGRLDLVGGVRTEVGSAGEGLYWRFENRTKQAEHLLGGSLAVVGEVAALRRDSFRDIPAWCRLDDMWLAADFNARDLAVSVDVSVVSTEPSAPPRAQLARRVRIVSAQIELLCREPGLFLRSDPRTLMLHGHKTWRTTGGAACQVVLMGVALRRAGRSRFAAAWLLLNVVGVADYLGGSVRDSPARRFPTPLGQALGMPPVVLMGAIAASRRTGTDGTWTSIAR